MGLGSATLFDALGFGTELVQLHEYLGSKL
jgi:hypothetical protein